MAGAERSMVRMFDQWRQLDPGLELMVITRRPEGLLQPELDARGIPWVNLTYNSWVLPKALTVAEDIFRSAREDFAAVRAIERLIREFEPDVVMTNTIVSPWAAVAAKLVGVPHVWFPREHGLDHEFALSPAETYEDIGTLSDLVVTNARTLRTYLEEWVEPEKLDVLYPDIDVETVRMLAGQQPADWINPFGADAALKVVCVSRITASKGQASIVRAVARLRDEGVRIEVALVGTPTPAYRSEFELLISDLDVSDRVFLIGEAANPFPYVLAADVGAIMSASEPFGRVTVEYMALARAVVGSRSGETPELVADGETGFLAAPDDTDELAATLRRYVDDPALIAAHGRAAEARVAELETRHRLPHILERVHDVIAQGSAPLDRLPHLLMAWQTLPDTSLRMLGDGGALKDPRQQLEWQLGEVALRIPRAAVRRLRTVPAARAVARRLRSLRGGR